MEVALRDVSSIRKYCRGQDDGLGKTIHSDT